MPTKRNPRRPTGTVRRNRHVARDIMPPGRRSLLARYGRLMRVHPIRTIAYGVLVLAAVVGLAAGVYYYTTSHGRIAAWSDSPAAAVGSRPPFANWQNNSRDVSGATVAVADDNGGKLLRFEAEPGPTGARAQTALLTPRTNALRSGQEVWLGLDVRLNGDLGTTTDTQPIVQLMNDTGGSASLAITANTDGAGLDVRRATGPAVTDVYRKPLGDVPVTGFSRIVIGMRLTKSPSTSWVEIWRDGQPLMLRENWEAYNRTDGQGGGLLYADADRAYLKIGLDRRAQAWPMRLDAKNIRIAPDRESVR